MQKSSIKDTIGIRTHKKNNEAEQQAETDIRTHGQLMFSDQGVGIRILFSINWAGTNKYPYRKKDKC